MALSGCLLQNPGFGDQESATGSAGSSGSTAVVTTGAPTTGAASDGGSTTTSGGASDSATGGSTGGEPTTGEVSAGTGSTGQASTGGSTTGVAPVPIDCPGAEVMVTLSADDPAARDTFVVTTNDPQCQWINSDGLVLNPSAPCEVQNYGGANAKYTVVGTKDGGHAEYLVSFGLAAVLEAQGIEAADVMVSKAVLKIVPWWSEDRDALSFKVGAIGAADAWVEGNKSPGVAGIGDSSWQFRWIESDNAKHEWANDNGPAAGSAQIATVDVPPRTKAEFDAHAYYQSTTIGGWIVQPWLDDPAQERGFVITIDDDQVLVKSRGTGFPPLLELVLCPVL